MLGVWMVAGRLIELLLHAAVTGSTALVGFGSGLVADTAMQSRRISARCAQHRPSPSEIKVLPVRYRLVVS